MIYTVLQGYFLPKKVCAFYYVLRCFWSYLCNNSNEKTVYNGIKTIKKCSKSQICKKNQAKKAQKGRRAQK